MNIPGISELVNKLTRIYEEKLNTLIEEIRAVNVKLEEIRQQLEERE